jgi:hypothetical protein
MARTVVTVGLKVLYNVVDVTILKEIASFVLSFLPVVGTLHVGRSSKGLRWAKGRKGILDRRAKLPPCPPWPPCDDSSVFRLRS